MFKLIAIRPLKGCAPHIGKCLKEGVFYYFCDDYRIDEIRGLIRRKSQNLEPLAEDFFLKKPRVNINAIVGKNGDGKSTLVELMMRLVNNCTITNDLAVGKDSLKWVDGVRGELYYIIDDVLYMLRERSEEEGALVYVVADLKESEMGEWQFKAPNKVDVKLDRDSFFFTLVSNYSHYAYNTLDYKKEWKETGNEDNDDEKCWLHYIFHKNDGYVAPITLHPFRFKGNIDVNREADLSKQRLLAMFINADDPDLNPNSLRRVNGKDAEVLVLREDVCKLQRKAIVDFFTAQREADKMGVVFTQVAKADEGLKKKNDIEYERLIDTMLPFLYDERLDEVLDRGDEFKSFVKKVVAWLKENHKNALPQYSDIERVWDILETLTEMHPETKRNIHLKEYKEKYGDVMGVNSVQLGRLDTIYRIFLLTGHDPNLLPRKYEELTKEEKSKLYEVYKVWSILSKYPQYEPFIYTDEQKQRIREAGPALEECYRRLNDDKFSHITRKLRQVFNYRKEGFEDGDLYERLGEFDEKQGTLKVNLRKLKEHYGGQKVALDQLPPAMYEWDLLFKKVGGNKADIELDSFSSGEKQLLNSTSAIIYHLQNLTATAITHYRNVNIILEEIELYYHPDYQRKLIWQLLNQIGRAVIPEIESINILFVTHSPFILSDIPKSQVLFLGEGMPKNTMQENTFGANIHSLLKNGFFLPNLPMGGFAYEKINDMFRKLNEGDLGEDYKDLYQQILLVGEPYLRSQLLTMYKEYKGLVD